MRNVSKTFPGVKALNNVQLKAWGGEVQALMGENGAGKSTLMKILSGAYSGRCRQRDPDRRPAGRRSPTRSPPSGWASSIIYQELSLAPEPDRWPRTSILGDEHRTRAGSSSARPWTTAAGRCSSGWAHPSARETRWAGLSIAEQQLVEIARALHAKSKILVLDEPTTALSSRETERLFALVRQLRAEGSR